MNGAGEAKLIFPGLAGIYAQWREIAYALVRVVIGYILLMHGWGKINTGIVGISGSMAKYGLEPSGLFAGSAIILETVGAVCIIIGLFTRFFAAAPLSSLASHSSSCT
jgi:putative oxidoreductase